MLSGCGEPSGDTRGGAAQFALELAAADAAPSLRLVERGGFGALFLRTTSGVSAPSSQWECGSITRSGTAGQIALVFAGCSISGHADLGDFDAVLTLSQASPEADVDIDA